MRKGAVLKSKRGATTAEYAIVLFALVVAVIATVVVLEEKSSTAFNHVGEKAAQFGKIPE